VRRRGGLVWMSGMEEVWGWERGPEGGRGCERIGKGRGGGEGRGM